MKAKIAQAVELARPSTASNESTGPLGHAACFGRFAEGDEGSNDRFWRGQAEQLIATMLWTAANTQDHTMRHVVRWVLELDRPQDGVEGMTG